jgi:hypothetical protein
MRFKPRNDRRKRTHQVLKESGSSILEDRWQRSRPSREFSYHDWGGGFLYGSKPRVTRSRFDLNRRSRRKEICEIWGLATSCIGASGIKELHLDC